MVPPTTESLPRPRTGGALGLATVVVAVLLVASLLPSGHPARLPAPGVPLPFRLTDASPLLGSTFHPGVILGAASNSTATLLAGIGYYVAPTDVSLPVLAELTAPGGNVSIQNLTADVGGYFPGGGVYAALWNGSAWLVGGQASLGEESEGVLLAVNSGSIENLTAEVGAAFVGGGIWAVGWNGTSWLVGGNSSQGLGLVALEGSTVENLSSVVPAHLGIAWIQMLDWNGTAWMIGGQGVFGVLRGASYLDLYPRSPFDGAGEFVAAWTGQNWLVGGADAGLVAVDGDRIVPAVSLPLPYSRLLVTVLFPVAGGWLFGGRGTDGTGAYYPVLIYYITGNPPGSAWLDVSPVVPSSFGGGEIQGAASAPELGPFSYVLVGEGSYNRASGHGVGAVALVRAAYLPPIEPSGG